MSFEHYPPNIRALLSEMYPKIPNKQIPPNIATTVHYGPLGDIQRLTVACGDEMVYSEAAPALLDAAQMMRAIRARLNAAHVHRALKRGQQRAARETAARFHRLARRIAHSGRRARLSGVSMEQLTAMLNALAPSDAR